MSYILDALKKAEAERHLGELPGLHTASLATPAVVAEQSWWRSVPALAGISLLAIGGMVALLWRFGTHDEDRPAQAIVVAPSSQISAPPSSLPPTTTQTPPLVLVRDLPVPPPLPKAAVPSKTPQNVLSPATAQPAGAAISSRPVTATAAPLPATASQEAPGSRVLALSQLPDALQRELPPLAIGGSMYSDNPADRMLLIDKRLLHEGDEVAPGLVLENLAPKAAVLRYKGYRFRLAF